MTDQSSNQPPQTQAAQPVAEVTITSPAESSTSPAAMPQPAAPVATPLTVSTPVPPTPEASAVPAPAQVAAVSPVPSTPALSTPPTPPAATPATFTGNAAKQIGKYKVEVIRDKCISAASCVAIAPKVFELDEQGIAKIISQDGNDDDTKLLAAQSCPTAAIIVTDTETGEQVWPRQ
jgi:ferredoxin